MVNEKGHFLENARHGNPEWVTIKKNEPDLSLHFLGSTNIVECGTNSKKIFRGAHWEIQPSQHHFYRCYKIL